MSELTVEPVAGVGDPSSPLYGQVLSSEDEKRIDDKGCPVISGLPWSEAGTGVYISVLAAKCLPSADRKTLGGGTCSVPSSVKGAYKGPLNLAVFTTLGRPSFNHGYVGACLELPSDLAKDELKKQYLIEWLVHTVSESLGLYGADLSEPADVQRVGLWVSQAAQAAIQSTGL